MSKGAKLICSRHRGLLIEMFGDTPLVIIENTKALESLVDELMIQPIIGVDTEADSFHHYQEQVCLMQISDLERDYIIDPLKIEDCSSLKQLFALPGLTTVLHGGDYDVVSLRRDFGITFSNIFDTMLASLFLGMPRIGLADLIEHFFGYHIDKRYQRHDWSRRPLLDEHLQYARGDTHFLLALQEVLAHKLKAAGRIKAFEEECAILSRREWTGRSREPGDFLRVKRSNTLDEVGQRVLRSLWHYRERRAKIVDRPVFKVLADPIMISLAAQRPSSREELYRVIRQNSALARKHGDELLDAIAAGLADETPLPKRSKKNHESRPSPARSGPGLERLLGPLKMWRNNIVQTQHLSPVVVANNQTLKEIARLAPSNLEELAAVPGIREWQVRDLGDQILTIIRDVPMPQPSGKKRRSRRRRRPES